MLFSVNEDSGEISTKGRVAAGVYNINVDVYDAVWDLTTRSTVTITIKRIDRQAVLSSGSVRFHGNYRLFMAALCNRGALYFCPVVSIFYLSFFFLA